MIEKYIKCIGFFFFQRRIEFIFVRMVRLDFVMCNLFSVAISGGS
jgi:hypothetical protein